jgi:hypothetical protein
MRLTRGKLALPRLFTTMLRDQSAGLAREMVSPQNGATYGLWPQLMGMDGDHRFIHSGGNRGFLCRFVGLSSTTAGSS